MPRLTSIPLASASALGFRELRARNWVRGLICLVLSINCLSTFQATAQDWPQWRGATHDGSAVGEALVDSFPARGPPVLWIRNIGQGYSGLAVRDGRVYTMLQTLYEQQLVCLSAETGSTLWATRVGWAYDGGGLYPGPRSTPTVTGEFVYYATPQGVAGCARASDGAIVWKVDFYKTYEGRGTEFGYSCSPLVVDDLVILPVGGKSAGVVAFHAADGSLQWKAGTKPASYSTPLPIEWRGEPLVIALMQNSLCCIHRRTGEPWWEESLSHGYDEHAAAPLYHEPHLLIAGPFKAGATQYELVADEATGRCKPQRGWESTNLSNDVASSVLVGDTIYGFDLKEAQSRLQRPSRGTFRALDWRTGEVRWSSSAPAHAQLIAADDKLIGFNDRGEVVLFRATPAEYQELGKAAIFPGEVCWTSPALANGRLYVRTHSRLACLYLGQEPLAALKQAKATDDVASRAGFDPAVLLGAERDYPATKPDASEFRRWYWFGMFSIFAATMIAMAMHTLLRTSTATRPESEPRSPLVLFWSLVALAGLVGSPLYHRYGVGYLFTWPVTLWAGYQAAIASSWIGSRAPFWSRPRAISYLVGGLFLALCGLYFHLCRWLGLAIEWCFLTGFVLSFPLAFAGEFLVHRGEQGSERKWRWLRRGVVSLVGFSGYYWASVWFMDWWLRT